MVLGRERMVMEFQGWRGRGAWGSGVVGGGGGGVVKTGHP